MAIGAVLFVVRETGNRVGVGEPCTLNPAAKMQRVMSALQTMLLGTELDATREEFPETDQVLRGTGSSSSTRWATGGAGTY